MAQDNDADYEIPARYVGDQVILRLNVPTGSKKADGTVDVSFPGIAGKLLELLNGSVVLEVITGDGGRLDLIIAKHRLHHIERPSPISAALSATLGQQAGSRIVP